MLWLTGLLGAVVVGAVAFLDLSGSGKDTDEETSDEAAMDDIMNQEGIGDFRATLDTLNSQPSGATSEQLNEDARRAYEELTKTAEAPRDDWARAPATEAATAQSASPPGADISHTTTPVKQDDWLTAGEPDDLVGLDAETDDLVLVWDDGDGSVEEPNVTFSTNPDTSSLFDISIGEDIVAQIPADSGITPDNIVLVPLSAAQELGWTEG